MTTRKSNAMGNRVFSVAAAVLLAASLSACANRGLITGSVSGSSGNVPIERMSDSQLRNASARIGQQYANSPQNRELALSYASILQMEGRADQSLAVMRKLAIEHPSDRQVLSAYGKSLAAAGELEPALDAVRRAQTPEYPDWRLKSAEGAILDQMGEPEQARRLYRQALDLQPQEPSVLSNLGMSHLLEGDLGAAESYMRQAVEQQGADSRVRQNLALVVGLQGRFAEAEEIASRELSPEEARQNISYLRSMLSQQNAWSELEDEDRAQQSGT